MYTYSSIYAENFTSIRTNIFEVTHTFAKTPRSV